MGLLLQIMAAARENRFSFLCIFFHFFSFFIFIFDFFLYSLFLIFSIRKEMLHTATIKTLRAGCNTEPFRAELSTDASLSEIVLSLSTQMALLSINFSKCSLFSVPKLKMVKKR